MGQSLVPLLIDQGHDVRCLSQSMLEHEYKDNVSHKDLIVVNMEDSSAIRQAMVGVDTIVHLASAQSHGGWKQLMEVDYRGTRQLLTAAKEMGVRRFVYLSLIHISEPTRPY